MNRRLTIIRGAHAPSPAAFGAQTPSQAGARRVLVAGCGFVGLEAARRFHVQGWDVVGITQSAQSARRLAGEPFSVTACDIDDAAGLAALGRFELIVDCVSSNRGGAEDYRRVYLQGARSLLAAFSPARIVFTGSTSVYAQTDGSIVTEQSPAEPVRETGRILRETEEVVLAAGGTVLRFAGLYGPERWLQLDQFTKGRAVLEDGGARWTNHLHRDDAADAIVFVGRRTDLSGVLNVADDTPMTQREVYEAFAAHFGSPIPPPGPLEHGRKRGSTSKRVCNARLRSAGWTPRFASIREALAGMNLLGGARRNP